jgi:predicted nucleic acid-binding protein
LEVGDRILHAANGNGRRHAAVMLNHGLTEIATFDEGFDRIEGIRRIRL